jgi:hypothetical protein
VTTLPSGATPGLDQPAPGFAGRIRLHRMGGVRQFLWLKTVDAVDLTVHCARSLVGDYAPLGKHLDSQELNLPDAPAWYFCGVTQPYVWAHNDHALLLPAPGEVHEVHTHGYVLELLGAKHQPIDLGAVPLDDPYVDDKAYRTCRNWQAAHWLSRHLGLPGGKQL